MVRVAEAMKEGSEEGLTKWTRCWRRALPTCHRGGQGVVVAGVEGKRDRRRRGIYGKRLGPEKRRGSRRGA